MSEPRIPPREFAVNVRDFGRNTAIEWRIPAEMAESDPAFPTSPDAGMDLLAAAKLQHLYVLRIRQRMTHRRVATKRFATLSGISYDRLVKVLRGTSYLRLEHLAIADRVLGPVSEFAILQARAIAEKQAAAAT